MKRLKENAFSGYCSSLRKLIWEDIGVAKILQTERQGKKKKRQQNDLLSCCKVQSDLTVKSKDGVNDVKLYCDL